MKVLIFGASGMVGQSVLRECLRAADVSAVTIVGRTASGQEAPKVHEIVHADLLHYDAIESQLEGYDACFFCLGISSAGLTESEYTRITYGITLAAAGVLARLNPRMTFVYMSGAGADSSEKGRSMWARVRGRTENALQRLPFKAVYLLRPGVIQPLHGIRSKTRSYRLFYALARPLLPGLRAVFPNWILSTEILAQAMLALAREGASKTILESPDIRAVVRAGASGS